MGRPPKDSLTEATADRVLRAAEEAFGRDGFVRTRLSDIAESVGIRRSSLLYYFNNKDTLYARVVEAAFADFRRHIDDSLRGAQAPSESIDAFIDSLLAMARERQALVAVIMREVLNPSAPSRVLIRREFKRLLVVLEHAVHQLAPGPLPGPYTVRSAILQIVSAYLVRTAAGDLGDALWGPEDHTRALARTLLLSRPDAPRTDANPTPAPDPPGAPAG